MEHGRYVCSLWAVCALGLFPCTVPLGAATASSRDAFRNQVEEDWLLRERYRGSKAASATPVAAMTTRVDAAGACDGVTDGRWGFHTGLAQDPWWQVDLGAVQPIGRVVVWNRPDSAANRADRLAVLLSDDGRAWRLLYRHEGATFYGHTDKKPLVVRAEGSRGRFVRVQLPGKTYLHLEEVEVFGTVDGEKNLALNQPADQVSVSQWSTLPSPPRSTEPEEIAPVRIREILSHTRRLIRELGAEGVDTSRQARTLDTLVAEFATRPDGDSLQSLYLAARWLQRELTLANPVLAFDALLVTKRVPGSFNHMSDQYIGWWSRPGGGIYIVRNVRGGVPEAVCITDEAFSESGSFLRPMLSYDARRVLFAWCRHYPHLAAEPNKLDKGNVPEDAFYHLFEIGVNGKGLRRLTTGKYDDFDGRYLPDGQIVFLSTRRGQFLQCGRESARQTLINVDLPDIYVRCGGGPQRPCVVYTLHTMGAEGGDLCAISPFEMFEWTPSVAHDGSILYSRWDYIDRSNMPYMSLWRTNPDGTNARIVYANFTRSPHCTFEPRSIPDSRKIVFTASAHHSQTKGSLVLLDPTVGTEGTAPMTRLTPEVCFPESEGWPLSYYANPWPLSERFYLVSWGEEGAAAPGKQAGWARWHSTPRPANGMGLYLFDAEGNMELLYRDPRISCMYPIPLRARPQPPRLASRTDGDGPMEGRFFLADVCRGLDTVKRGEIKALRVVAVPPKTHPTMDYPNLGVTRDDPGKCVLGTVPVEPDGSAYFRVPAGLIVFFQALDQRGMAVQTMRSTTHVQPGQTLGCAGCHEPRHTAPVVRQALAARRVPSKITPGPPGSWPFRFDRLVQPVLNRHCVECHSPTAKDERARSLALTPDRAYETLVNYGKPSLAEHVRARYGQGRSQEGACAAATSPLLALHTGPKDHHGVSLAADDTQRLIVWMDTYAQRAGSFSPDQERRLEDLRQRSRDLLTRR